MPVFRSTARRRPLRAPARRRSTRWAPPGRSAAAGVTLNLATFYDTFSATTLAPWWVDTAVTTPGPTVDPAVTAGAGLAFSPAVGKHSEVYGRYPFSLANKSVTFDITIPASTFTQTSSTVEISLLQYPVAGMIRAMRFLLSYTGAVWQVTINLDNAAVTQTYTTTTGAEWRLLKITSNLVTPTIVTVHRSPDGYVWTQVATRTFASAVDISSLLFYARGNGA